MASSATILLLDSLFLHAQALENCFDFTIFVSAEFETCLSRALARNQEQSDDLTDLEAFTVRNTSPAAPPAPVTARMSGVDRHRSPG